MANLLPTSSIVKYQPAKKITAESISPKRDKFFVIKKKLIEVDNILKNSFVITKKQEENKQKERVRFQRREREKKLEKKTPKESGEEKKTKLPPVPFLDRIKNFIKNVLLGFFVSRLVEYADKIQPLIPVIGRTFDWLADFTIKLIDGFGTFVQKGYEAYDKTRGWVGEKFGEKGLKVFDDFSSALNKFLNLAIVVGLASMASGARDRFGRPGKPGSRLPGGGISKPSAAEQSRNARIRNIQTRYGPGARKIYENALNNGKSYKAAEAAMNRGIARGVAVRPGADSLAARTASRGNILKGGLGKTPGRLGLKLFGKAGVKLAKNVFGRIPIVGPIIVAVASLLGGEPIGQALFKGVGAALGGLLGTFIPIPVIGTLLGETIGVFVGDLLYELILGKGPAEAGRKFKQAMKSIFEGAIAIGKWLGSGFSRFMKSVPKQKVFGRETPIPDIGWMLNPLTVLQKLDLLRKAFFPPQEGQADPLKSLGNFFAPFSMDVDGRSSSGGNIGSGPTGSVVRASHPEAGSGWTVVGQKDAQGRPVVLSKPAAEAFARMIADSGGRVKGTDVASSGRSREKNARVGGHPNSTHMYGEGLDIHGSSGQWMRQNGSNYNWMWSSSYKGHPGHFNFSLRSDTFSANVRDTGGYVDKGMFMNLGGEPGRKDDLEFVIPGDSVAILNPKFLSILRDPTALKKYASYERRGVQFIPIPISSGSSPMGQSSSTAASVTTISGGGEDWAESLYAG